MENLKKNLATEALEICGEEDRIRGDRIAIAPLEISKQGGDMEQFGHFHRRKDIVNIYSKKEERDFVTLEQIFEEAVQHATKGASRCSTAEAKSRHILRYSNLVFVSGQAGIGKSTLSKVLVQQMLNSDVHLYKAEFIFFIRFRDLDYKSSVDLLQFLTSSSPFISDMPMKTRINIIQHLELSENVYIVMDGLDEASLDRKMKYPICDSTSTTTPATIIRNLLSGRFLQKSKKIVTSRPRQLAQLPDEYSSNLYLNLLGLGDNGQWQVCNDLCCHDPELRDKIVRHISSRPDLKSLCYVPITCIIVMMSFYSADFLKRTDVDTLTAILVNALEEWFLKKLNGQFQTKEIAFLAYEGFSDDRFYFREAHLKAAKINFENTTTFLTNLIKFQLLQGKAETYFAHLMWQEFFVAVKLRLFSNIQEFKKHISELGSEKFEVVTRFLFGLCNKQTLDGFLDCIEIEELNTEADRKECESLLKEATIKMLQTYCKAEYVEEKEYAYFSSVLPILGWVREFGDKEFTKQASASLRNEITTFKTEILPSDIPNIHHILRARDTKLLLAVQAPTGTFIGDYSHYFLKELHTTLKENANIQVNAMSYSL